MKHTQRDLWCHCGYSGWLYGLLAGLLFISFNVQSFAAYKQSAAVTPQQTDIQPASIRQMGARGVDTERIVTIGGGVTEIVFALGKGRLVVATDTSSYFPNRAKQLPKIGYQHSLVADSILAFEPTLLLASSEAGPMSVIKQLQTSGLQVEQLNHEPSLKGLLQRIKRIGQLLGEPERALVLSNDVQRAFTAIDSQKQGLKGDPPRVLFMMQHQGSTPMVAGGDTTIDALIRLSGAVNTASEFIGFQTLSSDQIVVLNPEMILTTSQTLEVMGGEAYLWRVPGLGRTLAGREQNLVAMDALLLMGFGVRSAVATKALLSTWQTLTR